MQQTALRIRNLYKPLINVFLFLILLISMGSVVVAAADSKIVRVGVYENPPKIFIDDKGKPSGFWPDILGYMASTEGWEIQYVKGTWSECLHMLEKNEIDVMPDVAYSEERQQLYDFSHEVVYTSWSKIYRRPGTDIQSIIDLEAKTIAVLKGSINVEGVEGIKKLVKSFAINCIFIETNSYSKVFELIESGEADAGVASKDFGNLHQATFKIVETPIIFQPSLLYFAFSKESVVTPYLIERIDNRVRELKQDSNSVYYQALSRWLGIVPSEKPIVPGWVIWIVGGIAILLMLVTVGNMILRSQVSARTKSLTTEIHARKIVEETLRDSERWLSSIFDTINDAIFLISVEPKGQYRLTSINQAFLRAMGLPSEVVIGKAIGEVIPAFSLSTILEKFARAITEKTPVRWEEVFDYPNGRLIGEVNIAPVYNDAGNCTHLVGSVHDVTEHKQSQLVLEKSEQRYRLLAENTADVVWTCDMDFKFTYLSPSVKQLLGYDANELMHHSITETLTPESRGVVAAIIDRIRIQLNSQQNNIPITGVHEVEESRKDGSRVWIEIKVTSLHDKSGKAIGSIGVSRDITDRKRVEEQLRQSEKKYSTLVEQGNDGIIIIQDSLIKFANSKMVELIGFSLAEAIDRPFTDFVSPEFRELVVDRYTKRLLGEEIPHKYEVDILAKDGSKIPVELNATRIEYDGRPADMAMVRDITERKLIETQAQQIQAHLQLQIDRMPTALIIVDDKYSIQSWNPAAEHIFGFTEGEALGENLIELIVPTEAKSHVDNILHRNLMGDLEAHSINENITKDGRRIICQWSNTPLSNVDGTATGILCMAYDVTQQKKSEHALKESEERYRNLYETTEEGILIADIETKRFRHANPSICKMLGYTEAELKEMSLYDIHPKDSLEYIISDFDVHARQTRTFTSDIPCLRKDGTILYVDINSSVASIDDKKCNVGFFTDVTYRKLAEEERQQHTEKLLGALRATIEAMAMTVEIRDPYTSGHQKRVTVLACSIAREMGLTEDAVEAINMAGIIHDIGKIYVPAEILSKPGKLNEVEFSMIKMHPHAGYEILKNIEFPWPIAQAVLQHHERLDGSGYPSGFKNGEILLEAKILAVADTIESMASHRPYRAAIGIDKALDEISKNKDKLYDAKVVDTCLELFNNGKFEFPSV